MAYPGATALGSVAEEEEEQSFHLHPPPALLLSPPPLTLAAAATEAVALVRPVVVHHGLAQAELAVQQQLLLHTAQPPRTHDIFYENEAACLV